MIYVNDNGRILQNEIYTDNFTLNFSSSINW